MSVAAARAVRPAARTARPGSARSGNTRSNALRVVQAPQRLRGRQGLVVISLAMMVFGLIVLLLLAVSLQAGAYQMTDLRKETRTLQEDKQALQEKIAALQAPSALSAQARELGMVPATEVAVIRRSDGAVLGEAVPAKQPPKPVVEKVPAAPKPAADKPAADKPATDKPADKPAAPAAAKPADKPAEKPAEPASQAATSGTSGQAEASPAPAE